MEGEGRNLDLVGSRFLDLDAIKDPGLDDLRCLDLLDCGSRVTFTLVTIDILSLMAAVVTLTPEMKLISGWAWPRLFHFAQRSSPRLDGLVCCVTHENKVFAEKI